MTCVSRSSTLDSRIFNTYTVLLYTIAEIKICSLNCRGLAITAKDETSFIILDEGIFTHIFYRAYIVGHVKKIHSVTPGVQIYLFRHVGIVLEESLYLPRVLR